MVSADVTAPAITTTTDHISLTSAQEDICRICHGGSSNGNPLISPCRCSGSVRYCHGDCLVKWISFSQCGDCELCHSEYNIRRIGMKPYSEWRMARITCINALHMLLMFLCVLILVGSILWWTYVMHFENDYTQFYKSSTMQVLVYATYGPLDVMCVLLIILEVKFTVMPLVCSWISLNQRIEVVSAGKKVADTAAAVNIKPAATASATDWSTAKLEASDDFPGTHPCRHVPYEQLRNENEQHAGASQAPERLRGTMHAAPASDARPANADSEAAGAATLGNTMRLDGTPAASPPRGCMPPPSITGRHDRADPANGMPQQPVKVQSVPKQPHHTDSLVVVITQFSGGSADDAPLCSQSSEA